MNARPLARSDGVVSEELDDGVVVYDTESGEAHALDAAAARVWSAADGKRTAAELAATTELDEVSVVFAVEELGARGLLVESAGVSRRSLLRKTAIVGAAVAAAPVIETVVIPPAAAHASTPSGPMPD